MQKHPKGKSILFYNQLIKTIILMLICRQPYSPKRIREFNKTWSTQKAKSNCKFKLPFSRQTQLWFNQRRANKSTKSFYQRCYSSRLPRIWTLQRRRKSLFSNNWWINILDIASLPQVPWETRKQSPLYFSLSIRVPFA